MANELIIPFNSLLDRGVQRELIAPFNYNGFLNNTYQQAIALIKMICTANKRMSNHSVDLAQTETHNVIAFTGRRGTGKTSAMLSIADSLSSLTPAQRNELGISSVFKKLPHINVSILDENEDIFLVVLSKIFKLIDNSFNEHSIRGGNDLNYKAQKLKEHICQIYDHYVNRKINDNLTFSYNTMEKLSDRYSVREEFEKLIDEYAQIYRESNYINNYSDGFHLIICLDDIDLARQEHMRIMQCIHQYFMMPHIIVLVTLNFPILTASLQKETFAKLKTVDEKNTQNLHLSFEHTHDFLRKIIPTDMRITMPSWRKYDYRTLMPVYINFGTSKELYKLERNFPELVSSNLFTKISQSNETEIKLSPKSLILMLLAERIDVFLDAMGNKFHFMEPDSLRNLCDIFYMLYHMKRIPHNIEQSLSISNDIEANRKILLDYLYFKLLPENDFSIEEETLIKDYLEAPIERRGKKVWEYFFKCLTTKNNEKRIKSIYGNQFYEDQKKRFKIENYSFGDFFRVLYSASRLDIMKRRFVKFILASFSFSLPQLVKNEKWLNSIENPSYPITCNKYRKLRDNFGYTLLGTWCKDLFSDSYVDTVLHTTKFTCFDVIDDNIIDIRKDLFKAFISDFLVLLLMSARSTREPFDVIQSDVDLDYHINNHVDPTAFVLNSLCIKERLKNIKFKNKKCTYESKQDDNGIIQYSIAMLLNEVFKHAGYQTNLEELNDIVHNEVLRLHEVLSQSILWFFLEHTDLTYNVIKRAVHYIVYSSDINLKDKKINRRTHIETIQKFFETIYLRLKDNDDVYFLSDDEHRFSEQFRKHQIVDMFCGDLKQTSIDSEYKTYEEVFSKGCGIGSNLTMPHHT